MSRSSNPPEGAVRHQHPLSWLLPVILVGICAMGAATLVGVLDDRPLDHEEAWRLPRPGADSKRFTPSLGESRRSEPDSQDRIEQPVERTLVIDSGARDALEPRSDPLGAFSPRCGDAVAAGIDPERRAAAIRAWKQRRLASGGSSAAPNDCGR